MYIHVTYIYIYVTYVYIYIYIYIPTCYDIDILSTIIIRSNTWTSIGACHGKRHINLKEREGGIVRGGGLASIHKLNCPIRKTGVGERFWGSTFELLPRTL